MLLKICLSLGVMLVLGASRVMAQTSPVFSPGEKLVYQIRKLAMNVGEMTLVYEGAVNTEGRELLLLRLTVRAVKFTGDDKIYLDPETFLPVMVERDIVFFGKKELIREAYDPERGTVQITKTVDGKTAIQTITKDGPLENIYGFIFRCRRDGRLDQGQQLAIRLPTQDVTMSYEGLRMIDAGGQKVNAHYLESSPKAYRIWLDPSESKIPLRIDGAVGFGNTAMVLKEYVAGRVDLK